MAFPQHAELRDMRPKRRITLLSKEASWRKRVKTWPNMSSRRAYSSDSTSNDEESGGPSSLEASDDGVPRKTWLDGEVVKPKQEELSEAFSAGIVPPSSREEEDTTVVLKPKVGQAECLSSDGEFAKAGPMQGLDVVGSVESVTSSRDIDTTDFEKRTPSDSPALAQRTLDCTSCGEKLFSVREILEHPDLGVGICRVCYDFLFSSPYTKDAVDCSEEQCRWCGEGGRIVLCDHCDKVFCEACIVRNYGPKDLALIVSCSNWSCFCCDPELLRVPIDELREFQNSVILETNFPFRRKSDSPWAGNKRITRDKSNVILGTAGEGATIAELLAQEEERRKQQNKGMWTKSVRVKPPTPKARLAAREKKADASGPELHTRRDAKLVHHDPAIEAKQRELGIAEKQATEVKKHELSIDEKQAAPGPASPPSRPWIRPHQWIHKRQEAAERRKRAEAEAERLKNVTNLPNGGPKQNSNKQAKVEKTV